MEKINAKNIQGVSGFGYLDKINGLDLSEKKRTYLRYGRHNEIAPFVEIIIPTYKRPELLSETLRCILASVGFDDYQIIIMDNEGVSETSDITATERMIRRLNSTKIVYYREEENTPHNWNHLIKYARAKWLCMIHDDDLINLYHLKIMSSIVKTKKNIQYLGCRMEKFTEKSQLNILKEIKTAPVSYYSCSDYIWGLHIPLLGAFFLRENAVALGGFNTSDVTLTSVMDDYSFVVRYSFYYNTYLCELPLYKCRVSSLQATANLVVTYNCRVADYYLMREIAMRTHPVLKGIYYRAIEKIWLNKIVTWQNDKTYGEIGSFISELCQICNVNEKRVGRKDWFSVLYWGIRKYIFKILYPVYTIEFK